ncbi:RSP_7527 family protein [Thalassolituus sp. LLYu03]|uniref:RSP_7527 family protein n=1 Tax=Thalassolituus sp. LLYu03 TaxID=3421656 RepID=UPI003D26C6F0
MNTDNVKLTASGNVDVNYYVKLAHKLRQEEVARLTSSTVAWFSDVFHIRHDVKAHKVAH